MNIQDLNFDYNSPVVITYLFLSIIAWGLNLITHGYSNRLLFSTYASSPWNPLTYVRLVGHSIGHQDWKHLVENFLYILLVGPMIEEKYGSVNLLAMFLITSIVIGIFNSVVDNYILCGASGNVYMLIVLSSFANISDGKIPITLVLILLFYVSTELKDEILGKDMKISHFGHLLGAVCGGFFGFLMLKNPDFFVNILNSAASLLHL